MLNFSSYSSSCSPPDTVAVEMLNCSSYSSSCSPLMSYPQSKLNLRRAILSSSPSAYRYRRHRLGFNSNSGGRSFVACSSFSSSSSHAKINVHPSNSPASTNDEEERQEAREAVVDALLESGASREDAINIASNCPNYINTLIGNVQELDEHSLWRSWENEMELSFRRKVYYMAKEKRDNGLLPFLESLGLSSSSSMLIAGYASSQRLPHLITKVKYIREILLSVSDNDVFIGRNAQRMMMQLSIPIDEDIQQTLSFFEKMEAKRGGLKMLGYADSCLPFLIESFPRLLLLSVDDHLEPLFQFLQFVGVSKENIKGILLIFPPVFFYDVEKDIRPRMEALEKAGIGDKMMVKILTGYPWILSTSIQENYKEILSFFEMERLPKSSLCNAVKSWPHILGCSTNKMKVMMDKIGSFGIRNKMLGTVITSSPQLLLRRPSEFLEVVSFLEEIGFDDEAMGRILRRSPQIFSSNVEKTLKMKISVLADFGISSKHLPRVIRKYPELLVSDVHGSLLPRMRYLMQLGLSRWEVCSMIRRFSPLLGYSIEVVLKPKVEYLLNTMEKPLREVVEYPRYFSYSLEKKIKPRFSVLKGRNIRCSLKEMLGKNDEEFAEEYMGIGRLLVLPPSP